MMEKLLKIQSELKVPKGQYNDFGKFKYRSCEDILEAVKPILKKYDCLVLLSDKLVHVGERYYVEATAKFLDIKEKETIEVTASAREPENKKGMDSSQITGTASSYARKYALNGLLSIDDTEDADTEESEDLDKLVETLADRKTIDELNDFYKNNLAPWKKKLNNNQITKAFSNRKKEILDDNL